MIEIKGAFNSAICYTDTLEDFAAEQIKSVCDRPEFEGCKLQSACTLAKRLAFA